MQSARLFLFIITTLLVSGGAFAQSPQQDQIRQRFNNFAKFTRDLRVDSILAYTYPKLFTVVSPEIVKAQLTQVGADENMRVELGSPRLDSISRKLFTFEGESFALLYYHAPVTVTMLSEEYRQVEFYEQLGRLFAEQYGIENLSGDVAKFRYLIDAPKRMFAIRRKSNGRWYFMEYNDENPVLLDSILPKSVRRHFGLK